MPAPLVCTIGDVLLDVVVRLDQAIAADTDAFGRTHVGAGGQAGNVAAWVVALGGRGRVIARRANDAAGRVVAAELQTRGVELTGPVGTGSTGTVVSLATPDGGRAMLTDRGVSPDLAPDDLEDAWLAGCDWLHVSGYALVRSPLAEAAAEAARRAQRVSVDVSSRAALERLGVARFRARLGALDADVVFATEDEAALAGPFAAATVAVKRGARGCTIRTAGGERAHRARPAAVVDTTGAGDAFAAGFLLGGTDLALEAAARSVGTMGALP